MISILYVDDESTLLEVTKVYLERDGEFSVATCTSAIAAIGLIEEGSFDAVVSDYQMPGMDGLVFLKNLRSHNNAIPFILFTGKGREEVAIEALNSGADFYLQKGGEPKSQFAELTNKLRQAVQRRKAERALEASEEKYRDLVGNINDVLFAISDEGKITYISPVVNQFGYTVEALIGKPLAAFIAADDLPRVEDWFGAIKNGDVRPFEFQLIDASGQMRFVRASSRPVFVESRFAGIQGILSDITTTRTAESKISASEQRYRNVFEAAGDAILVVDHDTGSTLDANTAALQLFGYTIAEIQGRNYTDLQAGSGVHGREENTEISRTPIQYYRKSDGTLFPAEVLISNYPQKKRTIRIISLRDISLQKRAEERMIAAQRLYAILSQINEAIVRVKDLETLVAEICRISVESGRFRMAWIGLLDHESGTFRPVASAGHEEGYLAEIDITVKSGENGHGPTGTALREGHYNVCNDIETDPRMRLWRDDALKRGYRSSAAFPFRLHGEVVGAYSIYAEEKNFFNDAEITLLEEIAMDISFALGMLDEQARRSHAEKALAGSEERTTFLARILELSSQPFGVGFPDGRFGIVNPALCDLFGYTESEIRNMSWKDLTPGEWAGPEKAALDALVRTGIPVRYEKEYLRKDGSRVPVEMFVHRVLDDGGNIRYFYAFVTDITGRREAEDAVRRERDQAQRYLDVAGVMLVVLNPEGEITLINRKGCEILGYPESELLGKNWLSSCLPERIQNEVRGVFAQVRSGDTLPVEYHENPVLTKGGEERIIAFHNTLLLDGKFRIAGILFSGEDVTERKLAEQGLQKSRREWESIFSAIGNPVVILDPQHTILEANDAVLNLTGKSREELRTMKCWQVFHGPGFTEPPAGCPFERMTKSGQFETTVMEMEVFGGTYLVSATPVLDENGTLEKIIHIATDITERQRTEQALLESEGRYRSIFEKSADAILVMSDRFLDCNPTAELLFGCTRSEILGKTLESLSPKEQPGGRASADLAAEHIQAARNGTTQNFPWTYRKKNGQTFPALVSLIPARVLGEQRCIAIVHDCTVENHDKQQFRHRSRFPELNSDPVIEVSAAGDVIYANPACYAVLKDLGMPPDPAAFLPAEFTDLVGQRDSAPPSSARREVRIGTAIFNETLSYDEEEKTLWIFAQNITTRVYEANALELANRKLNLLSSITRHDIKNKLTGVLGYLELARGSTRDPDLIEYLNRAEISATAVRQQVEFTKEYENLGVKTPVWQEITGVVGAAEKLVDQGAVTVQDETRGLEVYADPMLVKVFSCLLENAISHGKNLTNIRIHGSPSPSGYLLVVEDDGVGVPKDQKEKIFNRHVGKGSGGFGLFLAREILSITGITVEETGEPGTGARFEISIPSGKFHVK